jgi:hypothetical protein
MKISLSIRGGYARLDKQSERKIRTAINNIARQNYWRRINEPLDKIDKVLEQYGVRMVDEDGTDLQAMFIGDQSETNIDLMKGDQMLEKRLFLSWYKMPSGKYEVVVYLT